MKVRLAFLTAFGLGYLRPAPGTWGSTPPVLVTLGLVWLLSSGDVASRERWMINLALIGIILAFTGACVVWGAWAESHFGRKDPSPVVADEVAGQAVALLWMPWESFVDLDGRWDGASALWNGSIAAGAFLLFRLFDIIKPPPANQLQRLRDGSGIVADDLMAGIYALLVMKIILYALIRFA